MPINLNSYIALLLIGFVLIELLLNLKDLSKGIKSFLSAIYHTVIGAIIGSVVLSSLLFGILYGLSGTVYIINDKGYEKECFAIIYKDQNSHYHFMNPIFTSYVDNKSDKELIVYRLIYGGPIKDKTEGIDSRISARQFSSSPRFEGVFCAPPRSVKGGHSYSARYCYFLIYENQVSLYEYKPVRLF